MHEHANIQAVEPRVRKTPKSLFSPDELRGTYALREKAQTPLTFVKVPCTFKTLSVVCSERALHEQGAHNYITISGFWTACFIPFARLIALRKPPQI